MNSFATALVTGASSGIGRALATALARRGTKVYVAARREGLLTTLVQELRRDGGRAETLVLDVSRADATEAQVRALDERDPIDLVIANAGIGTTTPSKRTNWPAVRDVLTVNLTGAAATIYGVLPGMVTRGRGHVAAVSSLAGFRGLPKFSAYSASKAGLIAFLESLRVDLHGSGIGVTTICPGFVRTDINPEIMQKGVPFLVEPDEAARIILRAIDHNQAFCTFPLPTALGMRSLALLPRAAYEFLLSHVKMPY